MLLMVEFFYFFLVNNWIVNFGFNKIKIYRNIDVDEIRVIFKKGYVFKWNIWWEFSKLFEYMFIFMVYYCMLLYVYKYNNICLN